MSGWERRTARSLARLRAANADAFPDVCTLIEQRVTTNALREQVKEDDESSSSPCRFALLSGDELITAQRIDTRATARLSLPLGSNIHPDLVIEVVGQRWQATYIHPVTGYSLAQWVDLRLEAGQP